PSPQPPKTGECIGWTIHFPAGKSSHTLYPFALHAKYSLPWGYEFSEGNFVLHASGCLRRPKDEEILCKPCVVVSSNTILAGIYTRICDGVDENSRLCFHLIENLIKINRRRTEQVRHQALSKLNDMHTIMRKMETID
ncbi:hypothetical protein B0H14DRAFT_3693998, partial [Mycena olivaceomarginata]